MFPLLSTKAHSIIDYVLSFFLITYAVVNYEVSSVHPFIVGAAGIIIFVLTFATRFEGGYMRIISVPSHLTSDILLGGMLAACPLFFEYGSNWHLVEFIGGLIWMGGGLCTRPYKVHDHKPVLSPDREGNPPE